MNLLHLAEAGLGLIVAYEAVVRGVPFVWKRLPKTKLIDQFHAMEAVVQHEADVIVHHNPHHIAEAQALVAGLTEAEQALVDRAKGFVAAKDAEIAAKVSENDGLKTRLSALTDQLHAILG